MLIYLCFRCNAIVAPFNTSADRYTLQDVCERCWHICQRAQTACVAREGRSVFRLTLATVPPRFLSRVGWPYISHLSALSPKRGRPKAAAPNTADPKAVAPNLAQACPKPG